MKRYILNSAVITTAGVYCYRLIPLDEAIAWLRAGGWESTIGYQETCDALSLLSGFEIPLNRRPVLMQAGDEALVFRLTCRLDNPQLKGKLSSQFVMQHCEIGILVKQSDDEREKKT